MTINDDEKQNLIDSERMAEDEQTKSGFPDDTEANLKRRCMSTENIFNRMITNKTGIFESINRKKRKRKRRRGPRTLIMFNPISKED
jgi:hypothetical protein